MSKNAIIKELTDQLIKMNFICTYHHKSDIHSDMFFDCQNSDEEPAKVRLTLRISVDDKKKEIHYYHKISEFSENQSRKERDSSPAIEGFQQFVSYQTVTGKTKHIYLDPQEIEELFQKTAQNHGFTLIREADKPLSEPQVKKRLIKENVPYLTIATLLILSSISLFFQLDKRDWITSLIVAILFILSTQIIPKWKWPLTAAWIILQMLIWLII